LIRIVALFTHRLYDIFHCFVKLLTAQKEPPPIRSISVCYSSRLFSFNKNSFTPIVTYYLNKTILLSCDQFVQI
ncbi:MAG: hypothetical protein II306_02295, partial [Clostridia bacterium]|nr:hypothetical protein [Clostridia bacterium]